MKQGSRKLIITLFALIVFAVIIITANADPYAVGAGITGILATVMYGYKHEYRNKSQ